MKEQIEAMAKVLCEDCAKYDAPCELTETTKMCDAVLEQAEALYNAGYRKQSEWISVEDRLPEKTGQYLTWHGSYYGIHYYSVEKQGWNILYCENREYEIKSVTHWMPLPERPKMKGGES